MEVRQGHSANSGDPQLWAVGEGLGLAKAPQFPER